MDGAFMREDPHPLRVAPIATGEGRVFRTPTRPSSIPRDDDGLAGASALR